MAISSPCILICVLALVSISGTVAAQTLESASTAQQEWSSKAIQPLFTKYCYSCHNNKDRKGDLDLTQFTTRDGILKERRLWTEVLRVIREEEMPPKDPLPSAEERRQLSDWVDDTIHNLDWSQLKRAGHVTIPRLTKDEYNNTMRDLLGLDLRPGDRLTEDGQGESGFVNDRDALFLTPSQLEKYLQAADQSLAAVMALDAAPMTRRFESESMFMTETKETPKKFGSDFVGYVLNRGQMTLYESAAFPHTGFYRFTIRARSTAGSTAALLRMNDRELANIAVTSREPAEYSAVCFVESGSHQMTWNVNKPPALRQPKAQKKSIEKPVYRAPPKTAGETVNDLSPKNAPVWPGTDDELKNAKREIAGLNATAVGVQRPYEWLRLLDKDGDPSEMRRFRGYVTERTEGLNAAMADLARVLTLPLAEVQARWNQHNAERIADNDRLFEQAGKIQKAAATEVGPELLNPGDVAIDWIELTGPVSPSDVHPIRSLLVASPSDETSAAAAAAATQVIQRFAAQAFRRPVSDSEVARYLKLFQHAKARGDDYPSAVRLALSAVLVSPHFLYRVEQQTGVETPLSANTDVALADYELASRLSYFLWLSMPDRQLFELAAKGQLRNPDVIKSEVTRMLVDQKSRAFSEAFTGQWLGFASLGRSVFPDSERFPEFTPQLAEDMKMETVLMFEYLLRNGGSLHELLNSNRTFLNSRLARHYEVQDVKGEQLQLVAVKDPFRGGLLGMGSVLTATSSPTRTSPVVRGKWVLETLLGQPAGDPPPDAGTLPGNAGQTEGLTLREEFEQHRRDPSCASCHEKIDPLGFGLENFDAIGRFRTTENKKPIDATGRLPDGTSFVGGAELKTYLMTNRQPEFTRNIVERLLSFALGRRLQYYDEPAILKIIEAASNNGHRLETVVAEIVLSYPFRHQSGSSE